MKLLKIIFASLIILFTYWWISSSPPDDFVIGPIYKLGKTPPAILAVESKVDVIANGLINDKYDIHGYDDITFRGNSSQSFLSGMDSAIWTIDEEENTATKIADAPLIPTGLQINPANDSQVYFCASRMGGETYPEEEKVGLYRLNNLEQSIEPIVLRLPIFPTNPSETTFKPNLRPRLSIKKMNETNSRPFRLCNDLAISSDGQRIYLSEPNPRQGAAMGSGAVLEAIGLAPIGKLWLYDLSNQTISLIADNYTFVDGLLLEESENGEAIFFTETTKFRLLKTYVYGDKAGDTELIWDNLPGMPDGLDRDELGNIWIGLIKKRSNFIGWVHNNPWVKPLIVRLPLHLLPISKDTGILALSEDGRTPLFYLMHDGSKLSDISVISPHNGKLYFPVFNKQSSGIFYIPNPLIDKNLNKR